MPLSHAEMAKRQQPATFFLLLIYAQVATKL